MRNSTRAAAIAGAVAAATASLAGPARAHPGGAVFVQANGLDGNAIVAYDGELHHTGTYPTGGLGGIEAGAAADPLASQGSLTLDRAHGLLYAVNAGSDTVTVFGVHGSRLSRLQVIGSGGAFPTGVAVHGDLVYVLNARDGGSIQGFRRIGSHLVRVPSWHRALGLDPAATPEFTHSPGQVAFTPDGRHLLVTTKGNTSEILAFGVDATGGPSARPVHNAEPDAVPFALTFDRWGHAVVAEAGPNAAATFSVHGNVLHPLSSSATGGTATCWVIGVNGTFYLSNAGSATITAFRTGADGSLQNLGTTSTAGAGTIDAAASADGSQLYAETGGGVDAIEQFRTGPDGKLTSVRSVAIPGGANAEGIAAY
ncbi:lactonase family protein [Actinoplanes sp. NPDC051343]|uniref:lactonase family protein n=1 Tax=Actinoplanes sp. NPDC051343 TaxID=3363906 RepID=UPI00378CAEC0